MSSRNQVSSRQQKIGLPADLESVSQQEIEKILGNDDYTKKQIIEIGTRRFGIPRSKLERANKKDALNSVFAALNHEKSLDVISMVASRGARVSYSGSPATKVRRHRFDVDDYARMGEAGILTGADRVELIAGEVREMSPIGPPHAGIVDRLAELLFARLAGAAQVRTQGPVRLNQYTEPEPDLAVLRRRDDYYQRHHPEAGEILLVIEVADSSLLYDRVEKMPRYAQAGIPEAWLVDVAAGEVTIYSAPQPDGYADERVVRRGEQIVSATIAALRLPSTALFTHSAH